MEALQVVTHTTSQPPGLPYFSCLAQWVGRNQPAWGPQVADGAVGDLPGDAAGEGQPAVAEASHAGWVESWAEEEREEASLLTPNFQPWQGELESLPAPLT